jgi:peptidoglycan/xylan/chitin deacetylase (PgdA/CDA1 family)
MRAVRTAGLETGIHCWDHVRWQDFVVERDAAWTEHEMRLAQERFESIFEEKPRSWAAAGWQTNRHAAAYQEQAGFEYASDTRGSSAFLPAWNGAALGCVQLPTTLPTLDELLGREGIDAARHLLALTEQGADHVFTAHAEIEGGALGGLLEQLITGWKAQGYEIVSLVSLRRSLDAAQLPRHAVVFGEVPGRSGTLALQGKAIKA